MPDNHKNTLELPQSLRDKLRAYRHRVWTVKLVEAIAGATTGVLIGFLLTYLLDRFFDTSAVMRGLILAGSTITCGLIPMTIHRWIYRRRHLEQLARLLAGHTFSGGRSVTGRD